MWLKLYQSASIWLVFGLSRCADPQVDRAAGADRTAAHRQQDRGRGDDEYAKAMIAARRAHARQGLAERSARLAKIASLRANDTCAPCCALTAPAATEASSKRKSRKSPTAATWIDLEEPTKEEEALVERCIHVNVPTQDEMAEIEPSSRLYERNGALYMTVSVLFGVVEERQPTHRPRSASCLPATGW